MTLKNVVDVIQNLFLMAQSTQIKSVISVPIKDFIHHYPRALFNDIPRVGVYFYDIPGSGRTFTTYPGRGVLLRHTRVGAYFYDIPGLGRSLTTYPGQHDIHLIIYVSGSNISLNIMYVLSLGDFFYCFPFGYIIINKSVFNHLNVTPCFVSIYMHTIYTVQNN